MMAGGYTLIGWLNGVKSPVFTHGRVSSDYACWSNGTVSGWPGCTRGWANYWNFNTGPPSMLAWAIGMLPYKDTFFSSQIRLGPHSCVGDNCLFANATEPHPYVHG